MSHGASGIQYACGWPWVWFWREPPVERTSWLSVSMAYIAPTKVGALMMHLPLVWTESVYDSSMPQVSFSVSEATVTLQLVSRSSGAGAPGACGGLPRPAGRSSAG